MNRTLFHQISVLVYAAMLILSAEYVHAQTHGQIPMFVQPGTGACNNAGGNDCLDSLITQDSYLTIDARERYSLTTRDGVYARPTGSIALCIGALLGDQKDGGSYILNRAGDPKWKLQFILLLLILLRTVLLGNPGIAITAGTSRMRLVNKAA